MGFDSSHTNFHSVEEVVTACLKQHEQRHTYEANEREIVDPLNVFSYGFSSFLNRREELVHSHLNVILIESRKKLGFQVNLRIDGAIWKAPKLVKASPLRVPMNSSVSYTHLTLPTIYSV